MPKKKTRTFTIDACQADVETVKQGVAKIVLKHWCGKRVTVNNVDRCDVACIVGKLWKWLKSDKERTLAEFEWVERAMRGKSA